MKKLLAIFLFLGILLQTFNEVVIVASYLANKNYIAKNLCENRDKPKMHCDGKCCLKKKLAKAGKDQAPSPSNQKSKQSVLLFFSDKKVEISHSTLFSLSTDYFSYNDLRTCSFYGNVFHPPSV